MTECKVMLKVSMKEAKARFQDCEDMEFEKRGKWVLAEDFSGTQLFGWDVSSWVELAGQEELIYAYYDEDMNAEFVHVKEGICVRAYLAYEGEVETDVGEDPEASVSGWSDVASYMDEHMV